LLLLGLVVFGTLWQDNELEVVIRKMLSTRDEKYTATTPSPGKNRLVSSEGKMDYVQGEEEILKEKVVKSEVKVGN
jgi:hypothetical protein